MSIADETTDLYPCHAKTPVLMVGNHIFFYRLRKAGPAGSAFKFHARVKQVSAAAAAGIQTGFVRFAILAREGALSTFLSGDVEFFLSKKGFPFRLGFFHSPGWCKRATGVSNNVFPGDHANLSPLNYFHSDLCQI